MTDQISKQDIERMRLIAKTDPQAAQMVQQMEQIRQQGIALLARCTPKFTAYVAEFEEKLKGKVKDLLAEVPAITENHKDIDALYKIEGAVSEAIEYYEMITPPTEEVEA